MLQQQKRFKFHLQREILEISQTNHHHFTVAITFIIFLSHVYEYMWTNPSLSNFHSTWASTDNKQHLLSRSCFMQIEHEFPIRSSTVEWVRESEWDWKKKMCVYKRGSCDWGKKDEKGYEFYFSFISIANKLFHDIPSTYKYIHNLSHCPEFAVLIWDKERAFWNQCYGKQQFVINRWFYDSNSIYDADDMNEWIYIPVVIYSFLILSDIRNDCCERIKAQKVK